MSNTEPTENFCRQDNYNDYMVIWNTNYSARNALSDSYCAGIMKGLKQASNDPNIHAVILAAEGGFFCAGGNLKVLKERRAMSLDQRREKINQLQDMIRAIRACPKPVIAAVEGGAAGAGMSVALACDMIVSAAGASFVLAYVRAGLIPDGGVTHALMKALPRATASRMALLAHPISAERLYELGAITEVVEAGTALEAAQSLAQELAHGPQKAIATIKSLLDQASDTPLEEQLHAECEAMAKAMGDDEAKTGIEAFLNKQRPNFRGQGQ
ncbi:MAG: 2-(1,2-epoxy-1,2-dihydrophenyl)acetyl-CoA isomerase [Parasphingorhabdus sp.]|jgi:2-(1,2-epoxy-1,2-dihydrophenyl)acetyl-CoA isomerase